MATTTDTRKIPENADVRDAVGSPVVATDPNNDGDDSGRLTYSIDSEGVDAQLVLHTQRRQGKSEWLR